MSLTIERSHSIEALSSEIRACQNRLIALSSDIRNIHNKTADLIREKVFLDFLTGSKDKAGFRIAFQVALNEKLFKFRIAKCQDFNPFKDAEAVKRALRRVQLDFPVEYAEYTAEHKHTRTASEEEILAFFKSELGEGTCYGKISAIFDKIIRGQCSSMPQSYPIISSEDVFYYQILQKILPPLEGPDYMTRINLDAHIIDYKNQNAKLRHRSSELDREREMLENQQREVAEAARRCSESFRKSLLSDTIIIETGNLEIQDLWMEEANKLRDWQADLVYENHDIRKHMSQWQDKMREHANLLTKSIDDKEKHIEAVSNGSFTGTTVIDENRTQIIEELRATLIRKYKEKRSQLQSMNEHDPKRNFVASESFYSDDPTSTYRERLESTVQSFSSEQNFLGSVELPTHTFGFQYGPRGCFIYDSLDEDFDGLFQYPLSIFFEKLRDKVRSDLTAIYHIEKFKFKKPIHYRIHLLKSAP